MVLANLKLDMPLMKELENTDGNDWNWERLVKESLWGNPTLVSTKHHKNAKAILHTCLNIYEIYYIFSRVGIKSEASDMCWKLVEQSSRTWIHSQSPSDLATLASHLKSLIECWRSSFDFVKLNEITGSVNSVVRMFTNAKGHLEFGLADIKSNDKNNQLLKILLKIKKQCLDDESSSAHLVDIAIENPTEDHVTNVLELCKQCDYFQLGYDLSKESIHVFC